MRGVEAATRDVLCDLAEVGHALHGVFHSHRMQGPRSVTPSAVDRRHQERLERSGYPVVPAIFSDDGYVRFFTLVQPFTLEVYGKGVEQHDSQLFRLTDRG